MTVHRTRGPLGPARNVLERLRRREHAGRDLLRIASYNIHGCVGADSRYDVERVAQVICELGCDTVGLQQVDGRPGLLTDSMQLEFLASSTGMSAVGNVMRIGTGQQYGNALLTLREVMAVHQYDVTFGGCEPRNLLDVALRACDGVIRVIVTHLGQRAAERRFQVKKILTLLRTIPIGQPVVLLGDINEWLPLGRPLRWLNRMLGRAPTQRSFPVWAPLFAFDRLWTRSPAMVLTLESHRTSLSRLASDHFPVKAVIAPNIQVQRSHLRYLDVP
ncbi:MAG TPA: endonuclease/exonuclease/phosphatase family protein [Steroidobacteraceae bacterium]|nr:endonuclease/exonuclease/phosphatase family protein [Steroidobacteraceae bacterium]